MLLGVKTMRGLRQRRRAWRRSRWKYCAAVEGWQMFILPSAASCMKRSMRALECSGSLAFVAVGQQQHKAGGKAPFVFAGAEELVDDDLRAVHKIAELRFPEDQSFGIIAGKAIFEAHAGGFRE